MSYRGNGTLWEKSDPAPTTFGGSGTFRTEMITAPSAMDCDRV